MPTDQPDLVLRPAVESDDREIAEVYLAARRAAPMPPLVRTPTAIRYWISARVQVDPVWVAQLETAQRGPFVVGYARFPDGWLDDLYVHPDHQGQGVGAALLELVQAQRPAGFCLWVFESNLPARRFYEQHGLVALDRTDGSGNEERAPDVRMAWPGAAPLAFYRSLINEVDESMGDLLARRSALTRVVQQHKTATGRPVVRDPAREAEIAASLAQRAPELGEERLRRILHAIISESLDAAAEE